MTSTLKLALSAEANVPVTVGVVLFVVSGVTVTVGPVRSITSSFVLPSVVGLPSASVAIAMT